MKALFIRKLNLFTILIKGSPGIYQYMAKIAPSVNIVRLPVNGTSVCKGMVSFVNKRIAKGTRVLVQLLW